MVRGRLREIVVGAQRAHLISRSSAIRVPSGQVIPEVLDDSTSKWLPEV